MTRLAAVAGAIAFIAAFALSCGPNGGSDTGPDSEMSDANGDADSPQFEEVQCSNVSNSTEVEVGPGLKYVPSNVTIDVGGTVKWTWASGVSSPHDVVADDDSDCSEARADWFESSRSSNPGNTYCVRFDTAGTWNYQCTVSGHCPGGMKGTVTVQQN